MGENQVLLESKRLSPGGSPRPPFRPDESSHWTSFPSRLSPAREDPRPNCASEATLQKDSCKASRWLCRHTQA